MTNTLLIVWSMFAATVVFAGGIWIALSPHGETWAGVALALAAGLVGWACLLLAREQWGLRRRHAIRREPLERRAIGRHQSTAATPKAHMPSRRATGSGAVGMKQWAGPRGQMR